MVGESWPESYRDEVQAGRPTEPSLRSDYVWLALGGLALSLAWLGLRARRGGARRLEDVMIRDVVTVDASATLRDTAERMREANVGVLPVLEFGQLRGVVTDRDLVVRAMARGLNPDVTRIRDCMSEAVVCARPDWDLEEARGVMAQHRIGRLPVVDERNRLLGIVTLGSLALRTAEEEETLGAAREVSRRSARA